jgi:hypothetical protein
LNNLTYFSKKSENSCFYQTQLFAFFDKTGFGYPPTQQTNIAFSAIALNKSNITQDVTTVVF